MVLTGTATATVFMPTRLIPASALRDRPQPEYLIEHVMAQTGIGQMVGPSYEGKSFMALGQSLCITNGRPWFGYQVKQPGPVIYCLMEGLFDFRDRIDAWLAGNPGTTDDGLWLLPEEELNLADPKSLGQLSRDIDALSIEPRLIVIDTQALATAGTDENSNSEMGVVMANLKQLAQGYGCFVLVVHHTGHDRSRARGASAQKAALDTEIQVVDAAVTITKVKSYRPSKPMPFVLESQGNSVWAKPSVDHETVLWALLMDAGERGVTKREGALAVFDLDSEAKQRWVGRAFDRWVERGIAVVHDQSKPHRWTVRAEVRAMAS